MSENDNKPAITAKDIMQAEVFCLSRDDSILDAVERLLHHGFSGAPVTENGKLVGVLSEVDCLRMLSAMKYHGDLTGTVADHMTVEVETVPEDHDIYRLVEQFEKGRRRMFVVGAEGQLLGVITRRDLLRAFFVLGKEKERGPSTYDLIRSHWQR